MKGIRKDQMFNVLRVFQRIALRDEPSVGMPQYIDGFITHGLAQSFQVFNVAVEGVFLHVFGHVGFSTAQPVKINQGIGG